MPNTKSAIRRVRRVEKQTQINRLRRSKYKHATKQMDLLLKSKDKAKAKAFFSKFQSILMQVAKSASSPCPLSNSPSLLPTPLKLTLQTEKSFSIKV